MLDEYLQGTLPQLIERGRLLKSKIPRSLPRDYGALIRTCEIELDGIIVRLRMLQEVGHEETPALQHARLRQFKRAVADLDHIETTAVVALNHAQEDDHHANRLLFRICQEIRYPVAPPTVTTLSKGYFYIDPQLNLMSIPPAEGNFLLHLPDLYHELGHPLLTLQNYPSLDRFQAYYLECIAYIHDHFAEQHAKEARRHGPREFKEQGALWELLWSKYWLMEFFCDLYAVYTLGPAFAWSHLHLHMKQGSDAFLLPDGLRVVTHPADDARMRAALKALECAGFKSEADDLNACWQQVLELTTVAVAPDYAYCYPDALIDFVVDRAMKGASDMGCRLARPDTDDPVHRLLNTAWRTFWAEPSGYLRWESKAVENLLLFCDEKVQDLSLPRSIDLC